MKDNAFQLMFKLSFAPIGLLFLVAVSCSFNGFTFFGSTDYGWDAFISMMTIGIIFCCVPVPILPTCVIYQIIYLVKIRKSAEPERTEAEGAEQKRRTPLFHGAPLCVGAAVVALVVYGSMAIDEDQLYRIQEARMARRAEQTIDLEEKEPNKYGLYHSRDRKLYVDYDTPSLGFCHDNFERVKLFPDTEQAMRREIEGSCLLQATIPLESPGKVLYAYSVNTYDLPYDTMALVMVMEDGRVYSCDRKHMERISAELGRTIYGVVEE